MYTEFATQRCYRNPVDEGALSVDLDDREPLAIQRFELCIAGDLDFEVVDAFSVEDFSGALTEMAIASRVQNYAGHASIGALLTEPSEPGWLRQVRQARLAEPSAPNEG